MCIRDRFVSFSGETFSTVCLLSLVLAENLLKSSPMCLLACGSSGILWKSQNRGFLWPKIAIFDKNPVLKDFD